MDQGKQQIALWLALPIVGLLLMLSILFAQGAVFITAPLALIIGVVVLIVFLRGRKRG